MPCALTQGKISNYRWLSLQRANWGVDSQEKTWRFPSLTLKENMSRNDGHCIPNSSQNVLSVGKFLGPPSAIPPENADAICQSCELASTLWLLAYSILVLWEGWSHPRSCGVASWHCLAASDLAEPSLSLQDVYMHIVCRHLQRKQFITMKCLCERSCRKQFESSLIQCPWSWFYQQATFTTALLKIF